MMAIGKFADLSLMPGEAIKSYTDEAPEIHKVHMVAPLDVLTNVMKRH
jgi:hypothetical protein